MMPAPSWPPTIGKRGTMSPWRRCSSEWHKPPPPTGSVLPLALGSSRSSSVISQSRPVPAASLPWSSRGSPPLTRGERCYLSSARTAALQAARDRGGGPGEAGVRRQRAAVTIEDRRVPELVGGRVDELVLEQLLHARVAAGDLERRRSHAERTLARLRAVARAQVAELGQVEIQPAPCSACAARCAWRACRAPSVSRESSPIGTSSGRPAATCRARS